MYATKAVTSSLYDFDDNDARAMDDKFNHNALTKDDVDALKFVSEHGINYFGEFVYGKCLYHGVHCKENKEKAFRCFDECSSKGNASAQMALYFYYETEGIMDKAKKCLARAIELEPAHKEQFLKFIEENSRVGKA